MSLNRDLIGKQYPSYDYGVTEEAPIRFAQAYNEDNPWFLNTDRPERIIAPPMFGVVMSWLSVVSVMTDAELKVDVLRLLHSEQDMYFYRAVVPGDIITSTSKIVAIEGDDTGESLLVETSCVNQRKEPVQKSLFTAFIRGEGRRKRGREGLSEETPSEAPQIQVSQSIDMDQTYRYAQASGDHNPIHVDENVAKMAGLPGIIVHGLCTMAFISKVMIDHLCARDPCRLKRLRACFSRPVFPGQMISTSIWAGQGNGIYTYETYNPERKAVIKGGIAEVAST